MDRRSTTELWMQTHTGRKFYPADIRPADICIEDIAHALSNICRFGGHCSTFYSVAQHSVHVMEVYRTFRVGHSEWVGSREGDLLALLHDASEAYLGDCVTPLKRYLTEYKPVEDRAMRAVHRRFDIHAPGIFESNIKIADRIMLVTEARDLLGSPTWTKSYIEAPLKSKIAPWSPALAKRKFLFCYNELTREENK